MSSALSEKPSILIVEDERIVALNLQQTLSEMGYQACGIASSADEAIARATEERPDIVLMDIRIKGARDGIQAAAILREKFDVPVVYVTGSSDDATLDRAKITEPHGYLVKPVNLAQLHSCIELSLFKHRMEIDKRLRERARWLSATLRSVADAVIAVDVEATVTFMNPAAEALLGFPLGESEGKSVSDVLKLVDRESMESGETPLHAAMRVINPAKKPAEIHPARLLNASTGAERWIDYSAAPVQDGKELLGAVMVFRDVTEDVKLQKRLEFVDRLTSLGTMAADTAHELNNPLAVVVGNAALAASGLERLRSGGSSAVSAQNEDRRFGQIATSLEDLQTAASRMVSIVSDLKAFSRPHQDTVGLVDLTRCVERAIRSTSQEFRQHAQLVTRFGDVPLLKADEDRLGQVIINLLVNAAQAIPPGDPDRNEVSVTTRTDDQGGAVIEIRDTGTGIPPDVIDRIFDPFFSTKAVGVGTGLGLSTCQGIVRSLGGRITVESEAGHGTTFCVMLPSAVIDTAVPAFESAMPPKAARILVVDDEPLLSELIRRILDTEDHQVSCADNGREALAAIEREEIFDVILCDLMMPKMTGMELYETLLGQNPELAMRMIFLTAGATTAKAGDFLRSVSNLVVAKPFQPETLLGAIQQILTAQQPVLAKAS